MTSSKNSQRGRNRTLRKREARVVYIVVDVGNGKDQQPQAHYVGSEAAARRLALEIHKIRRVPIHVHKAKVPKLTPRQTLLWALNFSDHGGMNHLGFGTQATCDELSVVATIGGDQ
tara:strand:- start:8600 stop:8947 length:348 start_codon:yes stop_codon:yes gene_type:complete